MNLELYIIYGILVFLIILGFGCLFAPMRFFLKAILHISLGFIGLLVCNTLGELIGVTVGVNIASLLTIVLLGPSGVPLLLLLSWSLGG